MKWKLIQCEMGLEANPLDLSKRKTSHTHRSLISSGSGGKKPDMLFTQLAVDSTHIYYPLIIFGPWWGINNLNKEVRIAALINNATACLGTGWMEPPRATHPTWAPKETSQNELRRLKGLSTIRTTSEERGNLWCFHLFVFPLAQLLCNFCRNMWSFFHIPACWNKKSFTLAEFFFYTH